jgi:hypothetical protein
MMRREVMRIVNDPGSCQGAPSDPAGVTPIADLARAWRVAEDRLFPLVMVDTRRYEWSVTLVGALAARLAAEAGGPDVLVAAGPGLRAALPDLATSAGIPLAALDQDLIVDAALAQRYRTLLAEAAHRRREETVAAARARGRPWAVVEEPDPASLAYGAAQWVELHTATGVALVRSVSTDPESGAPVYRVRLGDGDVEEFTDPRQWQRRCDDLRDGAR